MSIWILAIVLLLAFGALGYAKGAIRTSVSLVGILIGAALAIPLAGLLRPLMAPVGVVNPVWLTIIPPIIAFLLVYMVFIGIGFLVHHKVYLLYKYKHDDVDRIRWERMNRNVGGAVGVLSGAVLFLYVSGLIYAAGYLTTQVSAEDSNPAPIKFINAVRYDMAQTGFDKAAARFQPAPKLYYDAADIFGIVYNNPLLQNRLASYPYFLKLSHRPEFQEIATDKDYNDLIFGRAPVTKIIEHPRTQGLLNNVEVMEYLKGTDVTDLKEYLRTGKSPKYEEQEILGVWDLDKQGVLTLMRKSNTEIKARELRALRQLLEALPPVTFTAMPDGKLLVNSSTPAATADSGEPPADEAPQPTPPARQRQTNSVTGPRLSLPQLSGEGTWTEEAGHYAVTIPDASGKQLAGTARVKAEELVMTIAGVNLVFLKQ